MKVGAMKRSILLARDAGITPFIWGHRGIGKSSIVKQVCETNKLGFIDLRASQIEASDIRGIPARDEASGRTIYYPPREMPVADLSWDEYQKMLTDNPDRTWDLEVSLAPRLKEGILFLDEVNRAQDDVLQALFQLILDRRVGLFPLPPGWSIVCAGNYMEGYMTNGFTDPAFLNRLCHLILSGDELTLPEWVDYMSSTHGEFASQVVEFASQNMKHLYGDVAGDLGFSIQPSPRSWEMVVRVEEICKKKEYGDDVKLAVMGGLVGKELAISYATYSCPVKPQDLLTRGVGAMGEDLKKLNRNQLTGLMWGFSALVKRHIEDDDKAKVAMDFTRWMCRHAGDKDIAVAFCNIMVGGGNAPQRVKAAMVSNPNVGALLRKFSEGGKSFAQRLANDPELHKLVSSTAWGTNV